MVKIRNDTAWWFSKSL